MRPWLGNGLYETLEHVVMRQGRVRVAGTCIVGMRGCVLVGRRRK